MPLSSDFKQVHFRLPAFRGDWISEECAEVFAQTFAPVDDKKGSLIAISRDIRVQFGLGQAVAKCEIITGSRTRANSSDISGMSATRVHPGLSDAILASSLVTINTLFRAMECKNANLRMRDVNHRAVYGRGFILIVPKDLSNVLHDLPDLKEKLLLDHPTLNIPFGAVFLSGGVSAHARLKQLGLAAKVTQLYRELYLRGTEKKMFAIQQPNEIWE